MGTPAARPPLRQAFIRLITPPLCLTCSGGAHSGRARLPPVSTDPFRVYPGPLRLVCWPDDHRGATDRRSGSFTEDRRDAQFGPFAAYVPVIGILIATHYTQYLHDVARVAVVVFVVALGVLLAQLLAHWLLGNLPAAGLHPGYLLPTVAGPFIASVGLGSCGCVRPPRARSASASSCGRSSAP
ncbi:hypothetical protein [Winogradskya humida]|uniref:hypothetical protein n=1 Tax=Winogradskya humida TaxID=113566 RepID=UPI001941BED4|nr:hypothetical protein [Actinoplanes humidus]